MPPATAGTLRSCTDCLRFCSHNRAAPTTPRRPAERRAARAAIHANDVLAGIVHNQANLALIAHHHTEALALAERSVALHQAQGSTRGLAVALATLGQVFVQSGDLERAEQVLMRTLEVRSPWQFHETTGAVFDTLAQIHLMRGTYERAMEYVRLASEAYAAHPSQSMRWYEWSLRVLGIRITVRRQAYEEALAMASDLAQSPGVPTLKPCRENCSRARRSWRPAGVRTRGAGSNVAKGGSSRAIPPSAGPSSSGSAVT